MSPTKYKNTKVPTKDKSNYIDVDWKDQVTDNTKYKGLEVKNVLNPPAAGESNYPTVALLKGDNILYMSYNNLIQPVNIKYTVSGGEIKINNDQQLDIIR